MQRVVRCSDSTITEAWATVLGEPAVVVSSEAGAIVHAARKRISALHSVPSVAVTQLGPEPAPPFWKDQLAWGDGRYMARVGHRFLSVHFLQRTERYTTYEESIEPQI